MTHPLPPRNRARLPWTRLLLVTLCAVFAMGGSFTCKGSTHDDDVQTTTTVRQQRAR